ncbi:hypothetical protein DVH24_024309 [Malus domestica]|uniref:Uncharacterized protein n=1 Tax=Malus domestica TaxID=3750 RepID=A0A498JI60_MALDO|nr:hypothetical protein DVH24_024309 [Malus domestica]
MLLASRVCYNTIFYISHVEASVSSLPVETSVSFLVLGVLEAVHAKRLKKLLGFFAPQISIRLLAFELFCNYRNFNWVELAILFSKIFVWDYNLLKFCEFKKRLGLFSDFKLFTQFQSTNNLGNNEEGDLDFVSSLVNCTNLEGLSFGFNNFGGVLPESISNLSTKLREIGFQGNQIRGNIPIGVGNLINVERLAFSANLLAGTIPNSIGKLNKLYGLYLNSNELSGNVPSSLGNLTSLSSLFLYKNKLNGSIPQSLGDCSFLFIGFFFTQNCEKKLKLNV